MILTSFCGSAAAVTYSDEKISFGAGYSPSFPLYKSSYAAVHGVSAHVRLINDGFFTQPFLSVKAASGTAVKNGDKAGGMYGAVYNAPLYDVSDAGYFGLEAGFAFGCFLSQLFGLNQAAGISFSALYENEDIKGLRKISGMEKYALSAFVSTEAFKFEGAGAAEIIISASFNGRYDGGRTDAFFITAGLFFETQQADLNSGNPELYEYNPDEPGRKDSTEDGGVWE